MGESLKAIKEVFELTDRDLRSYSRLPWLIWEMPSMRSSSVVS